MNNKILSVIVGFALITSTLCSCSDKSSNSISDDTPWYDSTRIEIDTGINSEQSNSARYVTGYDRDKDSIIMLLNYIDDIEKYDISSVDFDYSQLDKRLAFFIDSGNTVSEPVDIKEMISSKIGGSFSILSWCIADNSIEVLVSKVDNATNKRIYNLCTIESNTWNISISDDFTIDKGDSFQIGGIIPVYNDLYLAIPFIGRDQFLLFDIEGNNELLSADDIFGVSGLRCVDLYITSGATVTVSCLCSEPEGDYSKTISLGGHDVMFKTKPYIKPNTFMMTEVADNGIYYGFSSKGIFKYNETSEQMEEMVAPISMNINLNELQMMSMLYDGGDTIILSDEHSDSTTRSIYKLKKADRNPNAGKEYLRIALFDYSFIDNYLATAIYEFNESSADHYAIVDTYDYTDIFASGSDCENRRTQLSRIKAAIKGDNGPDIIINAAGNLELESDDYLIDLNGLISTDDLFDNVIKSAETNGKLYQLPLYFNMQGLLSSPDIAPSNGKGFTFEEYRSLVKEKMNGMDPISYIIGREEYFDTLFSCVSNDIYDPSVHRWDFTQEEFRMLAEHCKNVSAASRLFEGSDNEDINSMLPCELTEITGLDNYSMRDTINRAHYSLYGLPSASGSGISGKYYQSAGITSCCTAKDSALDFIRILTSSQNMRIINHYTPINKKALVADEHNSQASVDEYQKMVSSVDRFQKTDSTVVIIIHEEMQAYYSGAKSLEETIGIIQNRVDVYCMEEYNS